jgi:hypothetical protein
MITRRTTPRPALLGLLVLGFGCYSGASGSADDAATEGSSASAGESGDGSEGADTGEGGDVDLFECDPDAIAPDLPLRRLSKAQYESTIIDLVRWAMPPADADAIVVEIDPLVATIPEDARETIAGETHGGFRRLDQTVHQSHVNASYDVATTVAHELVATESRRTALIGACATDADTSNDDACLDAFIDTFGARVMRRPLEADELPFFRSIFDGDGTAQGMDPEAFADVITVMLVSPQFLYFVEHGDAAVEGTPDRYWLSGHEIAARLSYHFWQTAPDDDLIAAAQSGALLTDEGYAAQVDRLIADPRTQATFGEFYREWLWLDDLPPMDALVGTALFDAVRGDFEPGPDTTANMVAEVVDMATWYTFAQGGDFEELFLGNRSFAKTDDIAQLYGVAPWTGGEPPMIEDPARTGLLTRAALVATGGNNTRPIMKGVFIRKGLLCEAVPPPPNNAAANPPELSDEMTTREVIEELTEQEATACAGCHATLINPLGFATENFDSLGRTRTEQTLFDADGNVVGTKPIDTSSIPQVVAGDMTPSSGAADLAQLVIDSAKPQACLSRNLVRFTMARPEDIAGDGCMMQDLATQLVDGVPLVEVLRAVALRPEFRQRRFE